MSKNGLCYRVVQRLYAKVSEEPVASILYPEWITSINNIKLACMQGLIATEINFCYGCESWSLTLREERRLRVFVKGVLRRIFGHNSYR